MWMEPVRCLHQTFSKNTWQTKKPARFDWHTHTSRAAHWPSQAHLFTHWLFTSTSPVHTGIVPSDLARIKSAAQCKNVVNPIASGNHSFVHRLVATTAPKDGEDALQFSLREFEWMWMPSSDIAWGSTPEGRFAQGKIQCQALDVQPQPVLKKPQTEFYKYKGFAKILRSLVLINFQSSF